MRFSDTFTLPKTSRYANPASDGFYLPYVFGDCSAVGGWQAHCIDTVNYYYCISGLPILSEANGNVITAFDADGVTINPAGYTVVDADDLESQGEIAYLDFAADPGKDVFVRCQGKPDSTGLAVIENPIALLEDWLTTMDVDQTANLSAFAKAKQIATDEGLTSGGVILQDQSPFFWFKHLLSSFLGDVWVDHDQRIFASLDLISSSASVYNTIEGFLSEKRYDGPSATRSIINILNQPEVFYAPNYTIIDRRFSEGVKGGNFDGYDDGSAYVDALSQVKYGVRQPATPMELNWIRTAAVAAIVQQRLVALYKDPIWLFRTIEKGLWNMHVGRGGYVVGGWEILRNENGDPLKNQIWQVLEIMKNLDAQEVSYLLKDTGYWYPAPPITYNGEYNIGYYDGRTRETRYLA